MIGGVGRIERRLAGGKFLPVEIAAVDDGAANRRPMSAEKFRRRIDHHGRAVIERARENRRRRIVHDQRHAELPPDGGDFGNRKDGELGIGQGLRVIGSCAVVRGAAEIFRIGGIDEANFEPLILQRIGEKIIGAAIEIGGGDDVVPRAREILHGIGRSRLPGGQRQRRRAALQRRETRLQHAGRRIADARVDLAHFLQREEICRMFRVVELIAGGLIDGHGHRAIGCVGAPAGMQLQRLGMLGFDGHGVGLSLDRRIAAGQVNEERPPDKVSCGDFCHTGECESIFERMFVEPLESARCAPMAGAHLRAQQDRTASGHGRAQPLHPFQRLPIGHARIGEAGHREDRRIGLRAHIVVRRIGQRAVETSASRDRIAPFRPFRRRQRQIVVEHGVEHVDERHAGDDAREQFRRHIGDRAHQHAAGACALRDDAPCAV